MFSEKNIPKLIIFTPIIMIIIFATIVLYSLITTQTKYLNQEIIKIEKDYINKQKIIIEKEINHIVDYIKYHEKIMIDNIKKNISIKMNFFVNKIKDKALNESEYLEYINQSYSNYSDFIIYDITKNKITKNKDVFFSKTLITSHIKEILKKEIFFYIGEESNLYYYKYIKKDNLIITIKTDLYYDIDNLKQTIAKWSEYLRFGENNYFWIYKNTNRLLAHPFGQDDIGNDNTLLQDKEGTYIVQNFTKLAMGNPDGMYLEHFDNRPFSNKKIKKLSMVKLYKKWNWIIGAGIYFDDIQKVITLKKEILRKTILEYTQTIVVIAFILIILITYISITISNKINSTIKSYQSNIQAKRIKLQNLNENLNTKIFTALQEAKDKDRAMLHQSRLARMGELLNMISHQWRQPLSQLSGIIMELETATIFNKVNNKYILSCTQDATEVIQHMSLTIEDFKNFFKPEKNKEDFLISTALNDAQALIKDTLINEKIDFHIHTIKEKMIRGYKREYSQVILNILVNAKDILIENNIINPKINIIIDTQDNESIVTIEDNAGGIKLKNINQIFEPYFSTKKPKGTGLGLYMSKMIIEKNMQGMLSVQNSKIGAVFKITV